jgi:hypothetical protein
MAFCLVRDDRVILAASLCSQAEEAPHNKASKALTKRNGGATTACSNLFEKSAMMADPESSFYLCSAPGAGQNRTTSRRENVRKSKK